MKTHSRLISRLVLLPVLAASLFILARAQDGFEENYVQHPNCWGAHTPCEDGVFRGLDGREQPASCNNDYLGKDGKPQEESHKCKCAIATTEEANCPVGGIARTYAGMGPNCKVSCREEACKCVNKCDAF